MNTKPFHLLFFSQKNARPKRPVNAPSAQVFRKYKKLLALALVLTSSIFTFLARAQEPDVKEKTQKEVSLELYGFIMMDAGHNYNQIDPNWFDVMRPTKLPAYQN